MPSHPIAGAMSARRVLLAGLALVALGLVPLGGAGCAGPKVTTQASPQLSDYTVGSVAVLPFLTITTPQVVRPDRPEMDRPSGVVRSDISLSMPQAAPRLSQATTTVPAEAATTVARIFARRLRHHSGLAVVPPDQAAPAVAELRARAAELPPEELARRVALALETDAALLGVLRVYKERVGSRYGAEPAVVGFEVMLVAPDGRVLWVGNYYEEQRPLTEDIWGFFARGLGFVTAEELASYGAEQLAEQFPFKA